MGCGSSAVEDPSTTPSNKPAGKPVHNSSDTKQKETVNKTKQEQPPSKKQVKSTRKKNDLKLNFDDLEDIDQHARTVPSSQESSIESLAEYLVRPAKNDLEKIRALYVWVCENISYNTDAFFGGTTASLDHSGSGVLHSRQSVCEGYARLFVALCDAVGIRCRKVSGYSKGYGYQPGEVISFEKKTNHAWNVVQLNGTWRFIESTWGAGHVDKNGKFVKSFTNFYFLTPPEDFIYDHFPYIDNDLQESNKWQLLDTPVTIETYSQMIKPSKEARRRGVEFSTHQNTLVKVDKSCTIKINATDAPFDNVWYDFFDSSGKLYNEAIMVLFETNRKAIVKIRPPETTRYKLQLHATICGENTTLVDNIIDCGAVEANYQNYPKNRGFYGPKPDFIERGFVSSDVKAFYICKNGEFLQVLKTKSLPPVLLKLEDAEENDNEAYTMLEQNDNSITIKARLIKRGYHKLTLFSKLGESSYTVAYTFIILNEQEAESKSLFPKTYTTTAKYQCKLIQPLIRELPANSEITFEFTSPFFESVITNKKVYQKENGDHWTIVTTTGESGDISVSGKIAGENSYHTVYQFTIKS